MSVKNIYIISIAILVFLFGMLGEHIRDVIEDANYSVPDSIAKFENKLQLVKDTFRAKNQAALVKFNHIKTYLEDTVQPALDAKNRINTEIKKYPVIIPVVFPGSDSSYYYKILCDSLIRQCRIYEAKLQNIVFHSNNRTDTLLKVTDSTTINLFTKNRWEYQKFIGLPVSRIGYTDIYSNDPNVKTISIKQDQPQFGFRLQFANTYNFSLGQLNTGASARFDLKTYQLGISYYYNWQAHEWRPVIGFYKDILRIY